MACRRSANVCIVTLALVLVAFVASAEPEKTPPAVASEADGKIATEIEHRLSSDPDVNAAAVELDVRGGVVTLTGRVPSETAKQRAEAIASKVDGVSRVRNMLSAGTAAGAHEKRGPGAIPERVPGHE
jgi:hypothetical protein